MYKLAETFEKLSKIYDDGRSVAVKAHVAEWTVLREPVSSLTNEEPGIPDQFGLGNGCCAATAGFS